MAADFGLDLAGEIGAGVDHGEDDALDAEPGIELRLHEIDGRNEVCEAFERVVLALEGE
jgi:hypothetical protein